MRKVRITVMKNKETGETTNHRCIRDEHGNIIAYAEKRSMKEYIDECLHGNNECAGLLEKFERIKDGKDAILWIDNETTELFITY